MLLAARAVGAVDPPQGVQENHVLAYQARTADARWQASAASRACDLSQVIKGFGLAGFRVTAGGKLHFVLQAQQPPLESGFVEVAISSPAWLDQPAPGLLTEVRSDVENPVVKLGKPLALRLFNALEAGMMPRLRYANQAPFPQNVEVRVSPVRFRHAAADFRRCVSDLASRPDAAMLASEIFFATDSADLTQSARERLDRLAGKFFAAEGITRVRIDGFADARGEEGHNQRLSERRAFAVRFYLVSRGVPIDAIDVGAFGAEQPVVAGAGESIWAQNRRVKVTLGG